MGHRSPPQRGEAGVGGEDSSMPRWIGRLAATFGTAALLLSNSTPAPGSGIASDNVTYLSTLPLEVGTVTGARQVGNHLFVAGAKGFSIYDVSEPRSPELLSTTLTGFQFPTEDVDTNGEILLLSNDQAPAALVGLQVWDVEDRSSPQKIGAIAGLRDHTFSCVLDCKWAYGSRGSIVDLRKPSDPKVAGSWGALPPSDGFDVTEVAPGIILTSSRQMRLLDARANPVRPKMIASGYTDDNRLIHSNRWPRSGKDDFFLVQGETPASTLCDRDSGAFMTWDARKWRKTRTFTVLDEFRVTNGTFVDGDPPANALGCTAMWFQHHPSFRNGGMVVSAFFEHGTRFLQVDGAGRIDEVGYFMPAAGNTIASYWIADRIVYALDVQRGIDILEFTGTL
jgi:hypothetical protein